jgi:hypothetical protein
LLLFQGGEDEIDCWSQPQSRLVSDLNYVNTTMLEDLEPLKEDLILTTTISTSTKSSQQKFQ